ncbi:AzlD domain-containing protein [Bacillus aerolatus]|uniref:AzlD domain-containing protein n=1 Tax=Bacillus aerolatus TaxID=2653354 RepID=A0A6I1FJY1_9BACI|nr:AzlD domain-containing protein [Bacillus aerolatus]KAB7706231.1 AzlD domain-containing protein [Bacillus aerolatus]
MSVNITILLIIIGCAVVTLIPRLAPFLIVRNIKLPEAVMKWLSFIPVCILTALIVGSVIESGDDSFPGINWQVLFALIPTLVIAIWTKSLLITVIFGIIVMAVLRNFM